MNLIFGQRVNISEIYVREREIKYINKTWGTRVQQWRIWKTKEYTAYNCIFLGKRTLRNGTVDYDEGLKIFDTIYHFQAALVCINEKLKPVLVPLDSIELKEYL